MLPSRSPSHRPAFTLVEVLIVVVILGILAALTIPLFADAKRGADQVAFTTDVKTFASAAVRFQATTGDYLEDSGSGTVPAGFEPYINEDKWLEGTPIGGVWDFEFESFGFKSSFGVHFMGVDVPELEFMEEIDALLDDGDLNTGGFRQIAPDRFYFILNRS